MFNKKEYDKTRYLNKKDYFRKKGKKWAEEHKEFLSNYQKEYQKEWKINHKNYHKEYYIIQKQMKLEHKIDLISNKLIELGFKKMTINKPEEENFHSVNEIDFIIELSKINNNSKEAKDFNDDYKKMLLNDFIPEISFINENFELEFFLQKNNVKITTKLQEKNLNECGMTIQEIVPFKTIDIDELHHLLIEKKFNLDMILLSGSN